MAHISLEKVHLDYPILGVNSRSFKSTFLKAATGGKLSAKSDSKMIVHALEDVSFHLNEGTRLGLIGHNGAGKSTLMKVIAGLYEPTLGAIHISGKVSALLGANVGMRPELNGYENIKIHCRIHNISNAEIPKIIHDIEEFTELGNFLFAPTKTYSAGMMVRLVFAMATAVDPEILLIDEVVGAGDMRFIEKAQRRLETLVNKSQILVLAAHSNPLIKKFCNKVLWLEHGRIRAYGETDEILEEYALAMTPV